ncbi:MAG: hypothetical protein SAJ12_10585 [Jaaginema sp. PMC 1079.18]|nr:hypothetical protein [Jaaginema sp. PMC 1080.18]MEC4851448.1 hypothetical protein [Jaaginema sp. PMC 1079.18]MEC4868249.1 hypothetical protein [Jaaginema sp. PMC 1078.18]
MPISQKRLVQLILGACLSCLIVTICGSLFAPTQAQFIDAEQVAPKIYEQLPDFPKANNYINKETGEVEVENTLISRLIRYHIFVKSRPIEYRLDWKLTLADYLGILDPIQVANYPGASDLTENPARQDIALIQGLTREQRNDFANAIAARFNNTTPSVNSSPTPQNSNPGAVKPPQRPNLPPAQGGADLLRF